MRKCKVLNCKNNTRYKTGKIEYCTMHNARLKRNGFLNLKPISSRILEEIKRVKPTPQKVIKGE